LIADVLTEVKELPCKDKHLNTIQQAFYIGKIILLISAKFVCFNLIFWFSGVLARSMEMNGVENHYYKRKKNRKGNKDTNTVHDTHENMYVYIHIACLW